MCFIWFDDLSVNVQNMIPYDTLPETQHPKNTSWQTNLHAGMASGQVPCRFPRIAEVLSFWGLAMVFFCDVQCEHEFMKPKN